MPYTRTELPQNGARRARQPGQSLETLPAEILQKILRNLELGSGKHKSGVINGFDHGDSSCLSLEKPTLFSCLLASRVLYANALPITYRSVTISRMSTFNHILSQITGNPVLGRAIRRLDLSDLKVANPRREFSNSLHGMLCLTPILNEIYLPHDRNLNETLSGAVLQILLTGLPHLKVLDFTNCTSLTLGHSDVFTQSPLSAVLPLKSLSLTDSRADPVATTSLLPSLFPRLAHIETMMLSKSNVTAEILNSIPSTARITHLAVDHCQLLETEPFVDFLISHPAVKDTLEILHASMDSIDLDEDSMAHEEQLTERFLQNAPKTLRSLRLAGRPMTSTSVAHLKTLAATAEDLSIGTGLRMHDLETLFLDTIDDPSARANHQTTQEESEVDSKYTAVLEPMERAIAICKLRQRLSTTPLPAHAAGKPSLRYLDIRAMDFVEQSKIRCSTLLGDHSASLAVIAVSDRLMDRSGTLRDICASVGWKVKREGRKCLLMRR
ncbi:Leucine Rich Repeat domain protein [Rutstroemia sp. NJR-2017a BVV2]|nr:Leucine Rich Repeat domain protein [Rutstroemia sp. NJR-2017a BVV2]